MNSDDSQPEYIPWLGSRPPTKTASHLRNSLTYRRLPTFQAVNRSYFGSGDLSWPSKTNSLHKFCLKEGKRSGKNCGRLSRDVVDDGDIVLRACPISLLESLRMITRPLLFPGYLCRAEQKSPVSAQIWATRKSPYNWTFFTSSACPVASIQVPLGFPLLKIWILQHKSI